MKTIGNWILGGLATVLGLVGLLISSRAHDTYMYGIGLFIAVACAFFVMNMIKQAFDTAEHG